MKSLGAEHLDGSGFPPFSQANNITISFFSLYKDWGSGTIINKKFLLEKE